MSEMKAEGRTGALYASLDSAAVEEIEINPVGNKIAIIQPLIDTTKFALKGESFVF